MPIVRDGLTQIGGNDLNALLWRDALLRKAFIWVDILNGLTAGGGAYSQPYDVTDLDTIRLEVNGLHDATVTPQVTMDTDPSVGGSSNWRSLSALGGDGAVTLDGFFRFLRFAFSHGVTAVAGLATPIAPTLTPHLTGGTLVDGSYNYRISAVNAAGQTLAGPEALVDADITGSTGHGSVTVTFTAVAGAVTYNVYGRTNGAETLLATLVSASPFLDDGSQTPAAAPGGNPPSVDTSVIIGSNPRVDMMVRKSG